MKWREDPRGTYWDAVNISQTVTSLRHQFHHSDSSKEQHPKTRL